MTNGLLLRDRAQEAKNLRKFRGHELSEKNLSDQVIFEQPISVKG